MNDVVIRQRTDNRLLYPKRYAVVVKVEHAGARLPDLVVRFEDDGAVERISLRARLGFGHCGSQSGFFSFGRGTRIKVFQRPQDRSLYFRRGQLGAR